METFREEIKDLGNSRPLILVFGHDAYELAHKHLRPEEYSLLVELPHYSRWISQEDYKELVFKELAALTKEPVPTPLLTAPP